MATQKRVVVLALDGSNDAENALEFYVSNVHKENDEVFAVHCIHHRAVYTYESVWAPVDPGAVSVAYETEKRTGDEVCRKIEDKLKSYKIKSQVLKVDGGDPGHTIVHKAEELGADAIVIGCRGLGKIRRTILGSVSDYVIHHAKCPVFVCRH